MGSKPQDTDRYSSTDYVLDDETVRLLDNSTTVLWDIPRGELTDREKSRLDTIHKKIDELRDIVAERKLDELD